MPSINIAHQSLVQNWLTPEQIVNPRTLVLGSFNPYFENGQVVDYFYGRSSNYFWKTIAQIVGHDNEDYFLNNIQRKLEVMNNHFCCLDIIDSIEFTSENELLLNEYIDSKVRTNFLDQSIFITKSRFGNRGNVLLRRAYNQSIINTLENSESIVRVIHTMGNSRIDFQLISPREGRLGVHGFEGFINRIKTICSNRNIQFVNQSYSPSAYAVRNGNTNIPEFVNFLSEHLFLNHF
jgi:hypothetical protein